MNNPYQYAGRGISVAQSPENARSEFIRKTYTHLAGAVLAFIAIEAVLLRLPIARQMTETFMGGRWSWLIVMLVFGVVGWVANSMAHSNASSGMQYAGLALYVVVEAVIFVPLLFIAERSAPSVISQAGLLTAVLFIALTGIVFITRKDFSFLRSILVFGFFLAVGVIISSMIFGFNLGTIFSAIMIAFAGGVILYTTSQVMHDYAPGQHVGASLALFSAVALMFWYVLRLLLSLAASDD